jgi:hypothetical protein
MQAGARNMMSAVSLTNCLRPKRRLLMNFRVLIVAMAPLFAATTRCDAPLLTRGYGLAVEKAHRGVHLHHVLSGGRLQTLDTTSTMSQPGIPTRNVKFISSTG